MKDFTFNDLVKFTCIPYVWGGSDFNGVDCYGLVKLWYRYFLNIELFDYNRVGNNYTDTPNGYMQSLSVNQFKEVLNPKMHDALLMIGDNGEINHAGVYIGDNVIHANDCGVVITPYSNIRKRIASIHRYKDFE